MKGNPLRYQEIHYYKRKPLTMQSLTVEESPFLYKEVPWKSFTIDGNPLLFDIEKSRDSPQHPYYRRKSLTVEENPLL